MDEEKILNALQGLIKIKSVKYDGKRPEEYSRKPQEPFGHGISLALDYVLELCSSMGMRTKNCDGYVGYAEIGEGDEMLGILMHLDVVPEGNDWTYPPYGGEIHDGKLYGRGAIDDKGPAVAVIFAVKSLLDAGIQLGKRVRLIFGTDEESDWEDMEYYTAHEEHPDLGFTPDADFPVVYGEKGILQLDLIMEDGCLGESFINGGEACNAVADDCRAHIAFRDGTFYDAEASGTAAHASTPEKGSNAISKVMEELYQQVGPLACSDPIRRLVGFYHDKIGFSLHGEQIGCDYCDEDTGRLTLNAGCIRTEADRMILSLDLRSPASLAKETLLDKIEQEVSAYGLKLSNVDFLKPVFSDCSSVLVKTLLAVYREETEDTSPPLTMGGGTYARAMDGIVAFGPLFPGREAVEHMRDEYILVDDLMKITRIYAKAIERLC